MYIKLPKMAESNNCIGKQVVHFARERSTLACMQTKEKLGNGRHTLLFDASPVNGYIHVYSYRYIDGVIERCMISAQQ